MLENNISISGYLNYALKEEKIENIHNSSLLQTKIINYPITYNPIVNSKIVYPSNYRNVNSSNLCVSYTFPSQYNKLTNDPRYLSKSQSSKVVTEEKNDDKISNTAEYSSFNQKENNLNQLIEDINSFGEITKKEIKKKYKENSNYYISIQNAFNLGNQESENKKYKNGFFVLALLANALKCQGCLVAIEKENQENNKEFNPTLQYLINGIYNLKKYVFYFNFGENMNKKLLNKSNIQGNFNSVLEKKLMDLFLLKENDIIMANPKGNHKAYSITAVIKRTNFKEFTSSNLKKMFIYEPEFNKIVTVKNNILLSGCILNPNMLESKANNNDEGWGHNEKRGGKVYYPPIGWVGYGLNIAGKYDNGDNSWIGYENSKGEWAIGYIGIGNKAMGSQLYDSEDIYMNSLLGIKLQFKDYNDSFHPNEKVGEGIVVTPKPKRMEENCDIFDYNGKKYKIGFMARLNPTKIRCPEGQDDYWVINGKDTEIRPYRILIKEF